MPTQEKIDAIAEFKKAMEESQIAIATQYIGINAEQSTDLRRKLREGGVQFKVFKNTLVRRALDELELADAGAFLDGPTGWAFCEDPVSPAKVLKDYAKEVDKVAMRGGVLEGRVVSKEQLQALADLPSQEQLLAQVVGTIAMPLRNFVSVMSAPMRNFVNVVEQIRKQKEESGEAA